MQGYTQYGGLRPFGVSLLYAGWDAQNKYQLYQSDPSGNYGGWKATAIGANQQARHLALLIPTFPDVSADSAGAAGSKATSSTRECDGSQSDGRSLCQSAPYVCAWRHVSSDMCAAMTCRRRRTS